MSVRFLTSINILAQRISYQSTCVKIRTNLSTICSAKSGASTDYYWKEVERTSNQIHCEEKCNSFPVSTEKPETPIMPVVAAVVAHRRIYPAAASTLISNVTGSQRLGLSVTKKPSHHSSKIGASGNTSAFVAPKFISTGGGGLIIGRGENVRPLVDLKHLGRFLNGASVSVATAKGSAILAESRRCYAKGKDKPKTKKTNVVLNEDEMGEVIDVSSFRKQLEKIIEQMKEEYTKQFNIRGGSGALESLQVEFEGEVYPLQELAQVGRKNPQLAILNLASLPDAIKPVLKAIGESGMNLNPQQEGTTIYVPLPKVTREHRETLAKNAKALFQKHKIALQGVQNKYLKQCKSQKELSDDLVFSVQQQIMKYTENFIAEAEKLMQLKQKELLDGK